MHRLIEQERVLAVVCNVGAPCAVTAVPIASAGKTLLYGYVTGGSVLRKTPPDRYVVNFRAGLDEEVDVLIGQFLARGIKPEEIAFFTQQDAYGDSAFAGGLAALQRAGLRLGHAPTHVRYPRNTMNIEAGLSELLLCPSNPKAVIIAGAGGPTVAIIREAKKAGFNPLFGTFSFVDAMYLAGELGSDAEGLIVTQVVPPLGSDVPMLRDYRSALKLVSGSEVESFASFESYLATRSLIEAIRAKPGDLSREAAVDALRGMTTLDLGIGPDRPVRMRKDGHTIAGYIWPTQIRSGRVELIDGASPTAAAEGGSR
jgi:ABC-type branched-subunit amino acid transport system substrate-binding protein